MNSQFDPYALGARVIGSSNFDPYALGATVVNDNQASPQQPNQLTSSNTNQQSDQAPNFIDALSKLSSNQLVNPAALFNIAMSNYNPITTAQQIAPTFGKIFAASSPEISLAGGLEGIANALLRVGSGSVIGASQEAPQMNNIPDLLTSLGKNALFNSGAEALTAPFRIASTLAEKMNPVEFTKNLAGQMKNNFDQLRQQENSLYNPVFGEYGEEPIDSPTYQSTLDDNEPFFPLEIHLMNRTFSNNPTVYNAHILQSAMGDNVRDLLSEKALNLDQIYALTNSQKALQGDLINSLSNIDKNAAKSYKAGSFLHATQIWPYTSNSTLYKISQGDTDVSPSTLQKALTDIRNNPDIPNDHYLKTASNQLDYKMNLGKLSQSGAPITTGLLGSLIGLHYGFPGLSGGLGTAAGIGGGLELGRLANYAEPGFLHLAQNPITKNIASIMAGIGYPSGRVVAGNLGNMGNVQ